MGFEVRQGAVADEAAALAELEQLGMTAVAVDFEPVDSEMHWHDFDSRVYVVDGYLRVELPDGQACDLHAGDMIEADARVLHREVTRGYRAVIGFTVDPTTLSMPIDKPEAELA